MQNNNFQLVTPYELIFLQDAFQINVTQLKDSQLVFLPQTHQTLLQQKTYPISFLSNEGLLDSALFERLQINDTNPMVYLYQSLRRLENLKEKVWNQTPEIQRLQAACLELVFNYLRFALISPDDLFPNRLQVEGEQQDKQGSDQVALRLLGLFEQMNFDENFLDQVQPFLREEFKWEVHYSLLAIINQNMRKITIFQKKVFDYCDVLLYFLNNEDLKYLFFTQPKYPWILGQSVSGQELEINSALGPFLKVSLMPPLLLDRSDVQLNISVGSNISGELSQKQTRKSYQSRVNNFIQLQYSYTIKLTTAFRLLLKRGDKLDFLCETFKYLTAVLVGNSNRLKMGAQLKTNKALETYSSDAFMMNLFDIMLEISRKIYDRNDDTYLRVDPEFWLISRNEVLKEQPIQYEVVAVAPVPVRTDAGNVSNLFFYTIKFARLSMLTTITNYKSTLETIKELKKAIEQVKDSQTQWRIPEMKRQLEELDMKANQYEAALIHDNRRIRDTIVLYDTFMQLLLHWSKIDLGTFKNGESSLYQPTWVLNHIPEHILDDIFEFHLFFAYHKEDYMQTNLNQNQVRSIVTYATLMTTQIKFSSNKYIGAKYIELVFLLFKIDQKLGYLRTALVESQFAKVHNINIVIKQDNFLVGLLKFYVDIESTGANHQFYSKFSYRLYVNELLFDLLRIPFYEEQLSSYSNNLNLERMIKMIMNDLNYSMDEGWSKVESLNKPTPPNQNTQQLLQQNQQLDFTRRQANGNLQHAASNIKITSLFSKLLPKAFLSDGYIQYNIYLYIIVYRDMLTSMFNHFLELLLDKKYVGVIKTIEQIVKQDFKVEQVLLNIANVYTNLMESVEFKKSIIKDQRCFKLDYFTALISRINQNPNASQSLKENLINLTSQLQEVSNEDFDLNDLLQNIPERYQDGIYFTIMKDPVKLPSSGVVMDRATIKMSLLDKEEDPYNRQPLKEKDLIDLPELKKEINEWIQVQLDILKKSRAQDLFRQKALAHMKRQSSQIQEEKNDDSNSLFQGRKQQFQDDE